MIQIPVHNCCGCTACMNVCPRAAIEMKEDFEGFLYPELDESKCIGCGLCQKLCPLENPPQLSDTIHRSVVSRRNDPEVLRESTSGGFMDALAEHVLAKYGGFVCGVSYDAQFMPVHEIVNNHMDAKKFRNSKYAQSVLADTFSRIKKLLQQEKIVLFIGTPCQVAGLKSFLQKDYQTLITADIVCRSIPSPKLWREYLQWQKDKHEAEMKSVSCRKKTYGYHSGALEIDFVNGKHYTGSNRVDYFMKCFHRDVCSRLSCYDCRFKTLHRCSDFTVFDSWKPDEIAQLPAGDDDRGYSNVLVHTDRGQKILEEMQNVVIFDANLEKMMTFTGGMERFSVKKNPGREDFYISLEKNGFQKTAQKYAAVSWVDRCIEAMKPLRYYIKTKLIK